MRRALPSSLLACLLVLAGACSHESSSDAEIAVAGFPASTAAAPPAGSAMPQAQSGSPSGAPSFLAYEHNIAIELPGADIAARLERARQACIDATFGECVVLSVWQAGGDHPSATLGMRLVPEGVEPMIALAGEGARLGSRSTRAEDLAVVVRDNDLAQQRLRKERERLQEFQSRRDLAVADMIALSRQLAETEAQLEAAEQSGAQHRRRIDTQLLTIEFRPTSTQEGRNEIRVAIRESGATLASGLAWTIRSLAFLLPALLVVAVSVVAIRRWRRRTA
ncbi:MAG: DUF4349 domain-containing protein [Luteimonas sp.]|nr:DUF4349 domain-containing protein [Luteimonas sp.]